MKGLAVDWWQMKPAPVPELWHLTGCVEAENATRGELYSPRDDVTNRKQDAVDSVTPISQPRQTESGNCLTRYHLLPLTTRNTPN
jgi:hypothetical protein